MTRLLPLLLALTGSSLALSGSTAATARLYAQSSHSSPVIASLRARTPLDIRGCTGGTRGWCLVIAAGKRGYLPRAQVKASGNCSVLRAAGLGDLRRGEASYNRSRDRDGDGLGCDHLN